MTENLKSYNHRLIQPGIMDGVLPAPPSKSASHRLLIMGALSGSRCTISNVLLSEDVRITIQALRKMGFQCILRGNNLTFSGNRIIPERPQEIFLGNSGTSARLLTAIAAAIPGNYIFQASPRMVERPMMPLLDALLELGADIRHSGGSFPVKIRGRSLSGGKIEVDAALSSQFISALMIIAPLTQAGLTIVPMSTLVSEPYIELTADLMRESGIEVTYHEKSIHIEGQQNYQTRQNRVEGDYSSASYFAVGAAITGGEVIIQNLNQNSVQGDRIILELLQQAGASIRWNEQNVSIKGTPLLGIDADMKNHPDVIPSATILALFAGSPSRLQHVEHLRYKESDRLQVLLDNIRLLQGDISLQESDLIIKPAQLTGARLPVYNDHRMAMSFALAGLKIPGISIENPACVQKSFPEFWEYFDKLVRLA
jgi:3-phosphoshikimate 1-carboxyvinyltransferase